MLTCQSCPILHGSQCFPHSCFLTREQTSVCLCAQLAPDPHSSKGQHGMLSSTPVSRAGEEGALSWRTLKGSWRELGRTQQPMWVLFLRL